VSATEFACGNEIPQVHTPTGPGRSRAPRREVTLLAISAAFRDIHVKLDNNELKQTEDFVHLGGTVSSDTSCDKDIARRVGLAARV